MSLQVAPQDAARDRRWGLGAGLDRRSRVPFYAQLKDILQARIEDGAWHPGVLLPSEADLCGHFGVSRTVVRQALAELVHEGLVVREQGRGSFVAQPKISEALVQRLTGFHQDMTERGYSPVSRVLRQAVVPASATLARHLEVKTGTPLIVIERLRLINGEPLVLVTTSIPRHLCPQLLEMDLREGSLYAVLESAGLAIARGRRWIEAVAADTRQAALLKVEKGAPLIRLESVSYLDDDTPVEFYHAIHRSDRARFEVDLVRLDTAWDGRKEGDRGSLDAARALGTPDGGRRSSKGQLAGPGKTQGRVQGAEEVRDRT